MGRPWAKIVVMLVVLASCEPPPPRPSPKFHVGSVVTIAQTGEKVTVLKVRGFREYAYECRVALPVMVVRDGLVSRDSAIARYSTVWFREFELRKR